MQRKDRSDYFNFAAALDAIVQNGINASQVEIQPSPYMQRPFVLPTESDCDFVVRSPYMKTFALRAKGNLIYFLAVDNKTGQAYTKEYFGVQIPAVHLLAYAQLNRDRTESFIVDSYRVTRFVSGTLSSDSTNYTLTAVLRPDRPGNESIIELIIDFTRVPGAVKYSFRMTKWYWPPPYYKNGVQYEYRVLPQFQLIAKTPHSDASSTLKCDVLTDPTAFDFLIRVQCDSRHLDFSIYPDLDTQEGVLAFSSLTGRLSVVYRFQVLYKRDGVDDFLDPRNPTNFLSPFEVYGRGRAAEAYFFPGNPVKPRFDAYASRNTDIFKDQAVVYLLPVAMKQFFHELLIDPTISLTLAIDSSTLVDTTPPAVNEQLNIVAIAAPTAVAFVVAVPLIVVVAVPSLRNSVFPFLARQELSKTNLAAMDGEDVESDPKRATSGPWKHGRTETVSITNQ
jgi:hypothetical protein